jgi:hypothetical protein
MMAVAYQLIFLAAVGLPHVKILVVWVPDVEQKIVMRGWTLCGPVLPPNIQDQLELVYLMSRSWVCGSQM